MREGPLGPEDMGAGGRRTLCHPHPPPRGPSAHRARCQQPTNDGPSGQDVRAEHLIRRVDNPTDVANEVAAQRLAVGGGQVLALEPVLVSLLLTKPHLGDRDIGKRNLAGRLGSLGRGR